MKSQTFVIELETTNLGCERAAKALAQHFGMTAHYLCTHLGNWEVAMPDGRHWTVERDSSVHDPAAEVVSPVCRWEDIPMVQEVVRALRRAGAKEDLLTQSLGILPTRRGRWCRPVEPEFLEALNRTKPTSFEAMAGLWYKHSDGDSPHHPEVCASHHYDSSRYHLLNLHAAFSTERPAHTIEFRAFNGSMHAGEVKAYIQLCLAISHKALTSKAASPTRPDTDNPKYTFRCWLLQLGFIGDEFETAREHLTKRLTGNAAWRQAS